MNTKPALTLSSVASVLGIVSLVFGKHAIPAALTCFCAMSAFRIAAELYQRPLLDAASTVCGLGMIAFMFYPHR